MSNQLSETQNQADQFIDQMLSDAGLIYKFNSILNQTEAYDLDDYADNVTDWLNEEGVLTDWITFCERFKEREKSDLRFWTGTYYLATDNFEIYRMKILNSKKTDDTANVLSIYMNGVEISDFHFLDKVLSWDKNGKQLNFPKGELRFSNYLDQNNVELGGYMGNYCEGTVINKRSDEAVELVGKVNVNSYEALKGGYSAVDKLEYWAGKYAVYTQNENGIDEYQGELSILKAKSESSTEIKFNDQAVNEFVYENGTLTWPGKKNNTVINNHSGKFQFTRTHDRKKVLGGLFYAPDAKAFQMSGAYQIEKAPSNTSDLEILSTDLPSRPAKEKYEHNFQAQGGTKPYKWVITHLPEGFGKDAKELTKGLLSGTPKTAGLYSVDVAVSDKDGNSVQQYFDLEITESKSNAVTSVNSITGIITTIISSLLAIMGVIIILHNKKAAKDLEEKKRSEAQEDLAAKNEREDRLLEEKNEREDGKEAAALEREAARENAREAAEAERVEREEAITERLNELTRQNETLKDDLAKATREANRDLENKLKEQMENLRNEIAERDRAREEVDRRREEDDRKKPEETPIEIAEHHGK